MAIPRAVVLLSLPLPLQYTPPQRHFRYRDQACCGQSPSRRDARTQSVGSARWYAYHFVDVFVVYCASVRATCIQHADIDCLP